MRYLKFVLLFFCLLCTEVLSAQEDLQLTYEEAVQIALRENLQIRQQENILETNQAEKAGAIASMAPSVNFGVTGQRIFGRQFDNTSGEFTHRATRLFGGIEARFMIFNGFSRINNIRQTRHAAEAQVYQINQTRQDIIFNVSQQYLQVLLNEELLRIARANLEQQQQLAESTETFVKIGIRNIAELYNQQSAAKNAALTVVDQENQLTVSKVQLMRTLQIDPLRDWEFTEPRLSQALLLQDSVSLEDAYNDAIANRADLKQQETSLEAQKYALKSARGGYLPNLSMGYYFGSQYSSLFQPTLSEQIFDINDVSVLSLNLNIPIFNNLDTRTQVQRNKQLLDNAVLQLEDLERNIFEQVQTAIADYSTAQERIIAAEAQVKAAEKALEAERERFRLGVGNILDLNRVNAAYVEALATKAQADYQLIFQKTALDYFRGKLQSYTD
jgi:outer membrane protein